MRVELRFTDGTMEIEEYDEIHMYIDHIHLMPLIVFKEMNGGVEMQKLYKHSEIASMVVTEQHILSPCHCLHCGLILNTPEEMKDHLYEKHCGEQDGKG